VAENAFKRSDNLRPPCFGQLTCGTHAAACANDGEAVSLSFLPTHHHLILPPSHYFLTEVHLPSPSLHFSTVCNMTDYSQSAHFRELFEHALQDYENQTGTKLARHPLAEQLQCCNSVDSILAILQQQTHAFTEFRGSNGRIMKLLKSAVSAIHALSSSATLSEVVSMVRCRVLIGAPPL
jgi:hypothetical protein